VFLARHNPFHWSLLTRQWKTENNIPSITWLAQPPDINIIENTSNDIKSHAHQNIANTENRQDLMLA